MTADQVAQLQRAAPFRPYTLLLADARSIEVEHPDFVSVNEDEEIVMVEDKSGTIEIIDLLLVVSLRYAARVA